VENASRYKQIGILALCLFFVPVIGWWTGQYAAASYESQFRDLVVNNAKRVTDAEYATRGLTYLKFCKALQSEGQSADSNELCSKANEVAYVKEASWGTAAIGLLVFVLILGGRAVSGANRKRMTIVFGPMVRVVMLLLSISVLAQGGLFVYSIYTVESIAINRVHGGILVLVSLGAFAACLALLKATFGFLKQDPMLIRAIALDRLKHQEIFNFVDEIAKKLKAQMPDHIVVGLEPNFFVTAADVRLAGEGSILQGKTLFISLGLLHSFTKDEFATVVGHELGHFRGEDVAYSMKFAPTYSRLGQAISSLSQSAGNASDLGKLPAQIALSVCLLEFAVAERTVGRERELLADRAGAEAASAHSLACALVKCSVFGPQWNALTKAHVDELANGKTFTNLAETYTLVCSDVARGIDWTIAREALGSSVQSHPVDTHPPLLQRLQNLRISLYDLSAEQISIPEHPAYTLIPDVAGIEESLSNLEAQWLVAIGAVVVPREVSAA
jgi:Zn-dependent protease with chaperone function